MKNTSNDLKVNFSERSDKLFSDNDSSKFKNSLEETNKNYIPKIYSNFKTNYISQKSSEKSLKDKSETIFKDTF